MKREMSVRSRQYAAALKQHLKTGRRAGSKSVRILNRDAISAGNHVLEIASLHEQILVRELLPAMTGKQRAAVIRRAGAFFTRAITPAEQSPPIVQAATGDLKRFIQMLSQRTVELAAANLELSLEISQRKVVEEKLRKSEHHYFELLKESDQLQEQLRQLTRQLLSAQEDERKMISRELHDVIGQTLTGITVRLAGLKKEAAISNQGFNQNIARTQRLVERSVKIVHRFARELRPTVLDDLGLIPALQSFMKIFSARTSICTSLTAFAGVEELDAERRTMLYRVAQEALTNVSRHADASRACVTIQKLDGMICMEITDDGKGFDKKCLAQSRKNKRLGLLGMRERVEMLNGGFTLESELGKGTTIKVHLRPARRVKRERRNPKVQVRRQK